MTMTTESERAELLAWKTVPTEPTREMWAAGGDASLGKANRHHDTIVEAVWNAMIAAAPPQPTPGFAEGFEACREAAKEIVGRKLADLKSRTETRSLPVHAYSLLKDQNKLVERLAAAIAALRSPAAPDGPKEVTGWRTMDSAPKDGCSIAVIHWWPSYTDSTPGKWGRVEIYSYEQDTQREQCWTDVHRSTCIREDRWIDRYRWAPLPVDLPTYNTITPKVQS